MNKGYDHKATAKVYWIFSVIFLIVGVGAIFLTWRQVNSNYVPTVATVIDSRMVNKTHDGVIHGYLSLVYKYEAKDSIQRYREPSYLVRKDTVEYDKFLRIVQSHPKDSVIPIHYNPRDPSTPIFGGIPANAYVPPMGISVLFICIGIGLSLLGFSMHKKAVWVYWAEVNKISEGVYEVSAADASGVNIGWKIGFAIIWNLFVVLAVVIAMVEKPSLSWQLILFFLILISGGFYLLLRLVIASFMAGQIFKQPKLIASKMPLERGDIFEIKYRQAVNKRVTLESVVFLLRCYEEEEVGQHSKSLPVRRTLFSDEKKINFRREFTSGMEIDLKQKFMIPRDSPLSSNYSVRYQVRWVLEVQVFARDSFDFHAEFPIEVAT